MILIKQADYPVTSENSKVVIDGSVKKLITFTTISILEYMKKTFGTSGETRLKANKSF